MFYVGEDFLMHSVLTAHLMQINSWYKHMQMEGRHVCTCIVKCVVSYIFLLDATIQWESIRSQWQHPKRHMLSDVCIHSNVYLHRL